MPTRDEVQHIAKLARLGLTEKEVEKFQRDLSSILGYIEKLKKVDISGVEPTSHSVSIENITRADESREESSARRKKLIEQFPEKENSFAKVKSIF